MAANMASNFKTSVHVILHLDRHSVCAVLVIINLTKFSVSVLFRCGCGKLIFCLYFIIFEIFKNVVRSLELGETPSYSASHQTLNYVL